MALPTTIVSLGQPPGYYRPFKSSGGAFYLLAFTTASSLDVYKATDPTDSFAVQDAANNPTVFIQPVANIRLSAVQDGDIIHIATHDDTAVEYSTFNMADDTWGLVLESVSVGNTSLPTWVSIAVPRSDGDVIIGYSALRTKVMGDNKERVDYARREGTTWTIDIALDNALDIHYGNVNVVKGPLTDDMHFVWQRQTALTPDPPTSWSDHEGRTLDSGNTLSTTDNEATALTSGHLLGIQHLVSYDDGGTQRITGSGPDTNQDLINIQATEDGSDDISIVAPVIEALTDEIFVNGEAGIITTAELNGDLHVLFSGGGANGVDQDLYYLTSTDDGVSWTTEAEEIDGITVNFISANIYERDNKTVLAYVYDDGGVVKYNEKVLRAGLLPQTKSVLQAVGRMGYF